MRFSRLLPLIAVAAVMAALPAVAQAQIVSISGTGTARYQAVGSATAFSTRVRGGVIRFRPTLGSAIKLSCVSGLALRTCARRLVRNDGFKTWRVLRPVRFLATGKGFRLVLANTAAFRLTVNGHGTIWLIGHGTYGSGATPYSATAGSPFQIALRR